MFRERRKEEVQVGQKKKKDDGKSRNWMKEAVFEGGKRWEVIKRIEEIRKVRLKEKEMIEKDDEEEKGRR